jgi:hypothetical protein
MLMIGMIMVMIIVVILAIKITMLIAMTIAMLITLRPSSRLRKTAEDIRLLGLMTIPETAFSTSSKVKWIRELRDLVAQTVPALVVAPVRRLRGLRLPHLVFPPLGPPRLWNPRPQNLQTLRQTHHRIHRPTTLISTA